MKLSSPNLISTNLTMTFWKESWISQQCVCSFKPDSKSENQIFQLTQTTIWNSTKAEEEDSKKEQICNKSRDLSRLEYKQSISQFTISRGHFPRDFFTNFNTSSDLHPLATNHTVLKLSILSTFIFGQNLSFDTVC